MMLIESGKQPDDSLNFASLFWLPPATPYGNLQLKLMKLCERVDEANRRLIESFHYWSIGRNEAPHPTAILRHLYSTEEAVYMMRRAADDLVALISCLSDWKTSGDFPNRIRVDCIGFLLNERNAKQPPALYEPHLHMLRLLNEISNAFKHSFVQTDINLIGRDEPTVNALSLDRNKLASGVQFFSVSLSEMVKNFSLFYKDGLAWLREFSEQHRHSASSSVGS